MSGKRHTAEQIISKLRDKLLNREVFYALEEAKVLVGRWREGYNRVRPHSAPGYRLPAAETFEPWPPGFAPESPSDLPFGDAPTLRVLAMVAVAQGLS